MLIDSSTSIKRRSRRGSQIAEFGPAIAILVCFVVLQLLDLGIVPVRWMLAQEQVNNYARKLALQETFSKAIQAMEADPSLATRLKKLGGIDVRGIKLQMKAAHLDEATRTEKAVVVEAPGQMGVDWLPGGAAAPSTYTLEVDVDSLMSPAFLFPAAWYAVPGITRPVPMHFSATHTWENLGRDPESGEFYLNE